MDSLILEAVAVAMAHRGSCMQQVTSGVVSPEYMGSRISQPGPSLAVGRGMAGLELGRGDSDLAAPVDAHCRGLTWH